MIIALLRLHPQPSVPCFSNHRCTIKTRYDNQRGPAASFSEQNTQSSYNPRTRLSDSSECTLGCNQEKWWQVATDGRCLEATVCGALTQAATDGQPFSSAQVLVTLATNGRQLYANYVRLANLCWDRIFHFSFFTLHLLLLALERMNPLLPPFSLSLKTLGSESSGVFCSLERRININRLCFSTVHPRLNGMQSCTFYSVNKSSLRTLLGISVDWRRRVRGTLSESA